MPTAEETVYLVAEDFGPQRSAWHEADLATANLETVIQDLLTGEYRKPIKVVAFNTAAHWADDVSEDIAREFQHRCTQLSDVPSHLQGSTATPARICAGSACAWCSNGFPAQEA